MKNTNMTRPAYITDEFYRVVWHDLKQYSKDYEAIIERTCILNDLQKKLDCRDEESYDLLKKIGTI